MDLYDLKELVKSLKESGMGRGREVQEREGRFYIYIYIYIWLICIVVWQKPTPHCKAVFLQLKIYIKKKWGIV